MKITDVTLTLFSWDSIPSTIYGHHTARPTGKSDLGLLRIVTDEGIEGNAFLGTSSNPASLDGPGLIRFLKPILIGPEPARPRAAQQAAVGARPRRDGPRDRRRRYRAVGHRRQDRRPADPPADRHLPRQDRRLCQLRDPRLGEAYVEQAMHYQSTGWHAYKIHPPQRWREDIKVCEAVARRSATITRSCSIRPGATATRRRSGSAWRSRRWGTTGTRTRCTSRTSTTTSSSGRSSTSRSWPPNTRSAASIHTSRGSPSAPPTCCAATSRSRAASRP